MKTWEDEKVLHSRRRKMFHQEGEVGLHIGFFPRPHHVMKYFWINTRSQALLYSKSHDSCIPVKLCYSTEKMEMFSHWPEKPLEANNCMQSPDWEKICINFIISNLNSVFFETAPKVSVLLFPIWNFSSKTSLEVFLIFINIVQKGSNLLLWLEESYLESKKMKCWTWNANEWF